jgi:hypothetical protein
VLRRTRSDPAPAPASALHETKPSIATV